MLDYFSLKTEGGGWGDGVEGSLIKSYPQKAQLH